MSVLSDRIGYLELFAIAFTIVVFAIVISIVVMAVSPLDLSHVLANSINSILYVILFFISMLVILIIFYYIAYIIRR